MQAICHYLSPLGGMTLAADETGLCGLWFDGQKHFAAGMEAKPAERELPVFDLTKQWLDIYFDKVIPEFTPPLSLKATPFRINVWEILKAIPYGQTTTYGAIADQLARLQGRSHMSAQAVGQAVGYNPVSLIIPCHRVIGTDGSLTGYAGGLWRKKKLLELEAEVLKRQR